MMLSHPLQLTLHICWMNKASWHKLKLKQPGIGPITMEIQADQGGINFYPGHGINAQKIFQIGLH